MSVNFLFILLGVLELSFGETLVIGFAAVLVQSYWKSSNLKPIHVVFNLSQLPVGTAAAYVAYQFVTTHGLRRSDPLALLLVAITYFAFNTFAMAIIIRLTEGKPVLKVWSECYFWSFPYYLVGAAIAGLVSFLNRHIGWQSSLLVLPPVYLMYRSYRLYLSKLEDETRHAEQVSNLHLRTIEALALAIEAKDHTTHDHLQRVRIYAMEMAKDLGLTADEIEALRAASVLHDIGKLAVPEHIISKPGKLTPEEFEKMKIHPMVGRRDSGTGRISLSGGANRQRASREVGWQRLSERTERGRNPDRGAHSRGGGLPRRAGIRSPVPARLASGRSHGTGGRAKPAKASIRAWSKSCSGAMWNWRSLRVRSRRKLQPSYRPT